MNTACDAEGSRRSIRTVLEINTGKMHQLKECLDRIKNSLSGPIPTPEKTGGEVISNNVINTVDCQESLLVQCIVVAEDILKEVDQQ